MSDKFIKCPECHGEGKFLMPNGETRTCQSCSGVGYLERVKKEDPAKEITNDDIANMLQRIHHENCFIFSALANMAMINEAKIDLVLEDWDEKFNKAKGEKNNG